MNIIHTGDWHLGKTIEGHSRLPEQELFLNDLVSICEERQPDMIIIAGDIYDTFNPPAAAEQLFYSTVKKMSRNGDCMVVVIAGNHDNPERLTAATSVLARHSVVIAGQPDDVLPIGKYGNNFIFRSGSGYIQGKIHGEKFDMILLPFPSERRMGHSILSAAQAWKGMGQRCCFPHRIFSSGSIRACWPAARGASARCGSVRI